MIFHCFRMPKNIYYSDKYTDEAFEYRHVMLPKELAKMVPKTHLMSETEWRNLGVQQSQGMSYSTHYSKSQIFVKKFNFDKTPTFSRVFHPKKIDNFLGKSKLNFWTKNEDFEQCAFLAVKFKYIFDFTTVI